MAGILLNKPVDQLVLFTDPVEPHTSYEGLAFEPHLTSLDDGRIAVSFRTEDSYRVLVGPPWPAFIEPVEPLPEPHVEPYHRQVPHFAYFTLDTDRGYGDHYEAILHAC